LELESSHPRREGIVVKFASVNSIEDAEKLRGCDLGVPRSEIRPLPEGEYYPFQLIGLRVVTSSGKYVGRLAEIMSSAGSDIYVVISESGESLIPAIEDVIKSIDLDKREMVVEEIEGLLTS
ncbi:MAG: 16S rRNA processing protein RimM, partial [Dehalococcoidia bacterium]|nr:16S rRNA processing protein RimM [Dehalococcoidia bacterium]